MSNQDAPRWYPSRQFTHTPEVPGAPASPTTPTPAPPTAQTASHDDDPVPTGLLRRVRHWLAGG